MSATKNPPSVNVAPRILLVDLSPQEVLQFREAVELKFGCQIRAASLLQWQMSSVLEDVDMMCIHVRNSASLEALRYLMALARSMCIPVLPLVSRRSDLEFLRRILVSDSVCYLDIPVHPSSLWVTLEVLLGTRAALSALIRSRGKEAPVNAWLPIPIFLENFSMDGVSYG